MAIFALNIENKDSINLAVSSLKKKLENPNIMKNPFKGFVKKVGNDNPYLFVYLEHIFFKSYLFYYIVGLPLFAINGFTWHWTYYFMIPAVLMSFIESKYFMTIALWFYFRKFGYKGKFKLMKDKDLLLRLAGWDREK